MATIRRVIVILLLAISNVQASTVELTTWNIEHLGSSGRGFGGGFGAGNLPLRSSTQLEKIARLIESIESEVVALQEVAVTHEEDGISRSRQLDLITLYLGGHWKYYLPPGTYGTVDQDMVCGYLWNTQKIRAIDIKPMNLPDYLLSGKPLFDRQPLLGYFEAHESGIGRNDFLTVNVHLKSGQDNDENHLVAMVFIEQEMNRFLANNGIKESDRIVLGDFNDNPYLPGRDGSARYLTTMYDYMAAKGYTDLVAPGQADIPYTRMNNGLNSVIDHIFANRSALKHIRGKAEAYYPSGGVTSYPEWRLTYSDHFPLTISLEISADDDVDGDKR